MVSDVALTDLPDADLDRMVQAALADFGDTSALARSALATIHEIRGLAVLNPRDPGAAELAGIVRIVLESCIRRLAPGPMIRHDRNAPETDWPVDPAWRSAHLLMRRFLHSLAKPDTFQSRPSVDQLCIELGIANRRTYTRELTRAVHEAGRILKQELSAARSRHMLQSLLVESIIDSVQNRPDQRRMLEIAGIFRTAFPSRLLLETAAGEAVANARSVLRDLLGSGIVQQCADPELIEVPEKLRRAVCERATPVSRARWHRAAVRHYHAADNPVEEAWHLYHAGDSAGAAGIVCADVLSLLNREANNPLLTELLECFKPGQLPETLAIDVQETLAYQLYLQGNHAKALTVFRRVLRSISRPDRKAETLVWVGNLYRFIDLSMAMQCLKESLDLMPPGNPKRLQVLLSKALFLFDRDPVSTDEIRSLLQTVLDQAPETEPVIRAQALSCEAITFRIDGRYETALNRAQEALLLWEQIDDPYHIADSYNDIAIIYSNLRQFRMAEQYAAKACDQFREFRMLHGVVIALGVLATAAMERGDQARAVSLMEERLTLSRELDWAKEELASLFRLVQFYARTGEIERLKVVWLRACSLGRQLDKQRTIDELMRIRKTTPALRSIRLDGDLDKHAKAALEIVLEEHLLTRRQLESHLGVSEATARRILAKLTDMKVLERISAGRSVHYALAGSNESPDPGNPIPGLNRRTQDVASRILDLARAGRVITTHIAVEESGVPRATMQRLLARLTADGWLKRIGRGRAARYTISKEGAKLQAQTPQPSSTNGSSTVTPPVQIPIAPQQMSR